MAMKIYGALGCATALLLCTAVKGQQPTPPTDVRADQFIFDTDKPFKLLEVDEKEEEPIPAKRKKHKGKVFYGIKTKKGFAIRPSAGSDIVEKFYYMKTPGKPSPFVRDIYWYDFTRGEVRKTKTFDPTKGALLHGPYLELQDKTAREEGIFYEGMKHGRWMTYDRNGALERKEKYYKGWPKESLISYYDPNERKRIREIVPIVNGERDGYYYAFYENGAMAVSGEYQWDHRVNDWTENYPTGRQRRVISYPENPFDRARHPFIKTEWNAKGKEIYSNRGR